MCSPGGSKRKETDKPQTIFYGEKKRMCCDMFTQLLLKVTFLYSILLFIIHVALVIVLVKVYKRGAFIEAMQM